MRVVVLGAGLIGVASAYYLWRDGHDVEVIEQHAEAASVTSYANACLVSASRALPWPTPSAHKTIWRALTDPSAPLRIKKFFDPALWRWGREFLSYANPRDYERLTQAKLAFANFCQRELEDTLLQTGVDCGYQQDGLLYVCRSAATMAAAQARAALVGTHGYAVRVLSRHEVLALEPSLASSTMVGGTFAVTDAQGDSRAFTRELAAWLGTQTERPVRFSYGETVSAKLQQRGRTFQLSTGSRELNADAFIVALGPQTPDFARMLGTRIPIYPVKGFSITVPVKDAARAPQRGGICEDSLIAYCPLQSPSGPVMRITTGAVFSGQDNGFSDADFVAHREHFETLFPGALDWSSSRVEQWACQRPMTPSSLPIIQRDSRFDNVYWNCGQGHIGWTMSCGSGRVIADLVAGRPPSFNLENMQQL
ncbi:MAG: FAD-dependent oxidoreductase [Rhizobacter sp.]|nr:FAD-dependent oxidoreductase [Burkholderiales bacterium]